MPARSICKAVLFDWGNTLMVDYPEYTGAMKDWPEVTVVDGVIDTLRILSVHVDCYLATNAKDSSKNDIRRALKRGGLDSYLKDIFCFQSLGYSKPESQFYCAISRELGLAESELFMVGDDLQNDVQGALDVGMNAVWFNPHGKSVDGYTCVRSFNELSGLFRNNDPNAII